MTDTQSVSEAWWEVLKYAHQPNATIKTGQRGSVNKIGVESADEIFFRKDDGDKRTVSRTEFNEIWKTLRSEGQITRKEVGEMTAGWAGKHSLAH